MEEQKKAKRGRPAKTGMARTAAQRQKAYRKRKGDAEFMIERFAKDLPAELAAIEEALQLVSVDRHRAAFSAVGYIRSALEDAQKFVDARG
ncbi:MAG: hypothetical protein ACT6QU_14675 [Aliihoeflea sp.]|uniref:hypothetical protein n=1 Tax=Aliihoeflea sp. TaxID=2608088 RepID=UPI004033A88C